jgi:hypothetical protein
MRFTIEPMSMGEIFSRAISLFFSRFGIFMAIEAIVIAPGLIFQLSMPTTALRSGAFLLLLPMILLGPIGSAAMLRVITQEYLGQRVSLGDAFSFAFSRFLPLLGTSILAGLGIVLGTMACCIPGIYLGIIWAFVSQVVVMENLAGPEALGRSKNLVEGYFWNVFGVLFVVGLCVGVTSFMISMSIALALPHQVIIPNPANPFVPEVQLTNYLNYAIHQVAASIMNGIGQTFTAICATLLYFDLRNRKEAFDMSHIVAWMGQVGDWRDEPVPGEMPPVSPASPDTGIKAAGDASPPVPPETGIQDSNAPRPDHPPQQ